MPTPDYEDELLEALKAARQTVKLLTEIAEEEGLIEDGEDEEDGED